MEAVIAANVGPPCLCVEVGCDAVKEPTENEQRFCFWQSRVVVRSPQETSIRIVHVCTEEL